MAQEQTGAIDAPFKTISAAIEQARATNGPDTVIVAAGTYEEFFRLPASTTLIGDGRDRTFIVNPDANENYTIYLEDGTSLLNLTVRSGKHPLFIPAHTKTSVHGVTVEDGNTHGIFTEPSTRITFPEYEEAIGKNTEKKNALPQESYDVLAQLPPVMFSDVTVQNNDRQGLYLQDARVVLQNSIVQDNGEEGIDLHPDMHATIRDNDVRNNGESGLESEIQNNSVLIENNVFARNGTNGVAFNSAAGIGDMTLVGNTIKDNDNYGIRCVRQEDPPSEPRPFFPTLIDQRENIFEDNGDGDFSFHCSEF
jgi:hypothetical protein